MPRKLPRHIGKIAAAVVAAAAPLLIKAVTDAVQKRLAAKAKAKASKTRRRSPSRKTKSVSKPKTNSAS